MTYIQEAVKTESMVCGIDSTFTMRMLHGAMGISTEAGELLDALKKHIFYGKDLDLVNLSEELGDLFWYMAIICDACGWEFCDIMNDNIEKLKKRYPEGFQEEDALNRNVENELSHIKNPAQYQIIFNEGEIKDLLFAIDKAILNIRQGECGSLMAIRDKIGSLLNH